MSAKHISPETLSEAIRGMKHSIKVLERNGVSDPDEPDKYGHIVSIKFDSDEDKKAYTDEGAFRMDGSTGTITSKT